MIIETLNITFGPTILTLTNQRAIFWEESNALILSDLHLGKAAHFRKHGIAIPTTISVKDLNRLSSLISHFEVDKVIIVGDLIHASNNTEVERFKHFKQQHLSVDFILIKGNHDRLSNIFLTELGIKNAYKTLLYNKILFCHHPFDYEQEYCISGHIHPGVKFKMGNKQRLSLPCYAVCQQQLILPAFSEFSGLDTKTLHDDTTYYPFFEQGIFKL